MVYIAHYKPVTYYFYKKKFKECTSALNNLRNIEIDN